jgi:hypothetical protein
MNARRRYSAESLNHTIVENVLKILYYVMGYPSISYFVLSPVSIAKCHASGLLSCIVFMVPLLAPG